MHTWMGWVDTWVNAWMEAWMGACVHIVVEEGGGDGGGARTLSVAAWSSACGWDSAKALACAAARLPLTRPWRTLSDLISSCICAVVSINSNNEDANSEDP